MFAPNSSEMNEMISDSPKPRLDEQRLHEIATILRLSFELPTQDPSWVEGGLGISDMLLALESPELREIMVEIKALYREQVQRLERLLSRHADNDTG